MIILSEINAKQVTTDATTEVVLTLVNGIVKKRNMADVYLKAVTLNAPNIFTMNKPTANPTDTNIIFSLANQTARTVFAAPEGANGTPSFRALKLADINNFYADLALANMNYWSEASGNVYRVTGKVFVGSAFDKGAYTFQVTGKSYFSDNLLVGSVTDLGYKLQVTGNTLVKGGLYVFNEDNEILYNAQEGSVNVYVPIVNSYLAGTETLLKTVNGIITRATAAEIASFLGTAASGNYILNQVNAIQSANFKIGGVGWASQLTATPAGGGGFVQMTNGSLTQAGYFEIYNSSANRLAYIGFHNTSVTYVAENGAYHLFRGGNVSIGSIVTPNVSLEVSHDIRINSGAEQFGYQLTNDNGGTHFKLRYFANNTVYSNLLTAVYTGIIIIGNDPSQNGTKTLQINGGIRQNDVISGLIYADSIGQFASATQAHVMSVLGDSAYIKNQADTIQTANFRISGIGRLPTILLDQSSSNSYAELQFRKAGILQFDFFNYTDISGNLYLTRYDDNGGYLGAVFVISRGTGNVSFTDSVGIGTTSPSYKLDVNGSGRFFGAIYIDSSSISNSAKLTLYQTGSNWWDIENVFPGHLKFIRGGVEHAMFTNMGKLLLNTSYEYTSSVLQVNGSITQRSVFSGLIYADSSGQLIQAQASQIANILGTGNYYIQNQYLSAQPANAWISGNVRLEGSLIGGIGAQTTAGVQNWNDPSNAISGQGYTLLLDAHSNGFNNLSNYYHSFSFEYGSRNGSGNMTQMAIPYGFSSSMNDGIWIRGRYDGVWNGWQRVLTQRIGGNWAILGGKVLIGTISETGPWKLQVNSGSSSGDGLYVNGKIYSTNMITSMSDRRQKKFITDVLIGDKLDGLKIRRYKYKTATDGKYHIGVLAQDFEKIFPELVSENDGVKSFDYMGLAAVAVGLGLETKSRVDDLEKKVSNLESENESLKKQIAQFKLQRKSYAS